MKRNSRFKKELDKNQKKITQFFTKPIAQSGSESGNNQNSVQPKPSTSKARSKWVDDGDYTEVEVLEPPPPSPKELVDLISSSDETEDVDSQLIKPEPSSPLLQSSSGASALLAPTSDLANENSNTSQVNTFSENSSGDDLLSQVDQEEIIRSSQEDKSINEGVANAPSSPFNGSDSSGDEVLSQIDIEEVIRSSQTSLCSNEGEHRASSPSILSTPNKENHQETRSVNYEHKVPLDLQKTFKSPKTYSPKSQLNKFSPIRHFRVKRTSSEASLDSISASDPSSSSPSLKSKFQNGTVRNNSQSPTKRKLDFSVSTAATASGGQARYFLRNFLTILTEIISDKFHAHLIHDEDHRLVQDFISVSIDAQHLFVRLFQRKWCWRPITKLNNNNKELPDDLTEACSELQSKGFLDQISSCNCGSLEEVLDTLDLGKLASLSKKMKLNPAKKTKEAIKDALLSTRKNQKTLTGAGSGSSTAVILKLALTELGPAFRVSSHAKLLFSRLFLLHSPPQYWEVENDQASNQLLIVLLNQMGQMEYPPYTIHKSTSVYPTRENLIQFHDSFSLHSSLVAYSEAKEWEEVVHLALQAKISLENTLAQESIQKHDSMLPSFLKIYTAGSVLTHSLWLGVDGFQKLKKFGEANELIRFLLAQTVYLTNYRGRWWERLVINSETHLKNKKEDVKELLEKALRDKHLKENHRLTLSQRLEKIKMTLEKSNSKKKLTLPKANPKQKTRKESKRVTRSRATSRKKYIDDSSEDDEEVVGDEETSKYFESDNVETQVILLKDFYQVPDVDEIETLVLKNEIPTRTITGEKLDQGPGAMGKSVFISRQDSTGSNRMGSVEQFVIDYYLEQHGYSSGIHGEGSTVTTIYGLLFWDVIFCEGISDAFHHRYQPFPLDFHFEDFYIRRKDLIEEKLTLIRSVLCMEDLLGVVDEIWEKHEKKLSIVSWSMFEDNKERLKSLMKAMGNKMIADICERLAKNYRHYSSGFPDLVVWKDSECGGNEDLFCEESDESCDNNQAVQISNKKVLFVEVKGPGDHLSEKQQLWLDFLVESGIPAEVCLVKAVSNKRIRLGK